MIELCLKRFVVFVEFLELRAQLGLLVLVFDDLRLRLSVFLVQLGDLLLRALLGLGRGLELGLDFIDEFEGAFELLVVAVVVFLEFLSRFFFIQNFFFI